MVWGKSSEKHYSYVERDLLGFAREGKTVRAAPLSPTQPGLGDTMTHEHGNRLYIRIQTVRAENKVY